MDNESIVILDLPGVPNKYKTTNKTTSKNIRIAEQVISNVRNM